jgi:predicted ester cyclase
VTLEKVVEEGDTAFGRWTATLTHTGEGLGIAPTGRALKVCGMSALRVQGGEIVEGWNNWDQIGLARQLGILGGQAAELFG